MTLDFEVLECHFGVVGAYFETLIMGFKSEVESVYTCNLRRYRPEQALYEYSFSDRLNTIEEYIPWKCNDYSHFETDGGDTETETGNVEITDSGDIIIETDDGDIIII